MIIHLSSFLIWYFASKIINNFLSLTGPSRPAGLPDWLLNVDCLLYSYLLEEKEIYPYLYLPLSPKKFLSFKKLTLSSDFSRLKRDSLKNFAGSIRFYWTLKFQKWLFPKIDKILGNQQKLSHLCNKPDNTVRESQVCLFSRLPPPYWLPKFQAIN